MDATQFTTNDVVNIIVLVLSFPAKRYPYCRKKKTRDFQEWQFLEIPKIFHKCHLAALVPRAPLLPS